MLAGSAGGHLDLLKAVAPGVTETRRVVWVTSQTSRGEALREHDSTVELVPEFGRDPRAAARNVLRAARIVARHRPRVLVSAGAGVVVPLSLLARLAGARLIFVETMARVTSPSQTCRLLSRFAARTLVQWPELVRAVPHAAACQPVLLAELPEGPRTDGEGTFVAVGTHSQPFTRLVEIVERACTEGLLPAPVFVQTGPARAVSAAIASEPFISGEELRRRLTSAAIVICHGGAGIISSALSAGHTPIVVPRRAALAEHTDDHQYQLTRKLAEWGLVILVEERLTAEDVARARAPLALPAALREGATMREVLERELSRLAA